MLNDEVENVVLTSAYGVNKLQNDGTCVLEERKYIEK
jgi:hypothetical protein